MVKVYHRIVVSTDDAEIAEVSKRFGAEIIDRPKELAEDESLAIDVVFHVLETVRKSRYVPDIVVLLQPTSPLRTGGDIDNAIRLFLESDCESVISVSGSDHPPYWTFMIQNQELKPIFGKEYFEKRRQDLPKCYIPNGSIYISTPLNLMRFKSFYCCKTIPYIMPAERSIDIDNKIDLKLAELILREKYE